MTKKPELPGLPRLRPGATIILTEDGGVLRRSSSGTLMLSCTKGDRSSPDLARLLSQLDGTRSVAELSEAVGGSMTPSEVQELLEVLRQRGLLVSYKDDGDHREGTAGAESGLAFWGAVGLPIEDVSRALGDASVSVVGLGHLGMAVVASLLSSGVGRIFGIHGGASRPAFNALDERFALVGQSGSELTSCHELLESDFIVVCSDGMAMGSYDVIGKISMARGVPWLSARIDRTLGIIGPLVEPGKTACFTCYELRSRANSTHAKDHDAMFRFWRSSSDERGAGGDVVLPGFAAVVGNIAAMDVVKHLGGYGRTWTLGRVLHIDINTLEANPHSVLKLPRCPTCSTARHHPLTRIWDISAPAREEAQ